MAVEMLCMLAQCGSGKSNENKRPSEVRETISRIENTLNVRPPGNRRLNSVRSRKCFASSKKFRVSLPVLRVLFASLSFYSRERFIPKVERIRRRRLAESKFSWISFEWMIPDETKSHENVFGDGKSTGVMQSLFASTADTQGGPILALCSPA